MHLFQGRNFHYHDDGLKCIEPLKIKTVSQILTIDKVTFFIDLPQNPNKIPVVSHFHDECPASRYWDGDYLRFHSLTQSRMTILLLKSLLYCFAAIATLLKKQNPRGWPCSA